MRNKRRKIGRSRKKISVSATRKRVNNLTEMILMKHPLIMKDNLDDVKEVAER